MGTQNKIFLLTFFAAYLFVVLFTEFSLTGFWTDIIVSVALSVLSLWMVFRRRTAERWLTITLRAMALILSGIVFGLIFWSLTYIGTWDYPKLRSFYYQKVDGRVFNAYFKPVGAYSGGYGNFWISETPKYFPVIERRVYYERTVHWDFGSDSSDGQAVGDVLKSYIREEVIDKNR